MDPGFLLGVFGLLSLPKQAPVDGVSSRYLLPTFLSALSGWNSLIVAPPPSWSPTPTGVYNMSPASANFIRARATPSSCSLVQAVHQARPNTAPQGACQTLRPARPISLSPGSRPILTRSLCLCRRNIPGGAPGPYSALVCGHGQHYLDSGLEGVLMLE